MSRTHRRTSIVRSVSLAFGLILVGAKGARCAGRADLEAAFFATFGQHAPLVRTVEMPVYDTSPPAKVVGQEQHIFDVRPDELVPLSGSRYALISYETERGGGHSTPGEIAVSYLTKVASQWRLERLWPELLASGVGGEPANVGEEVHRFGHKVLFMARTAWCGMGECSEWIGVIHLSPDRPLAYGDVLAGAISPTEGSPIHDYEGNSCQNYDATARVEPPRTRGALFSVRYDGWTSPPNALSPKTPLHLVTSYIPVGMKLVMRPVVPVPTCGR